tara:strand:- start:19 stop:1110 length:1092 start_codon:yes stop_codon:yes gene_type:complete
MIRSFILNNYLSKEFLKIVLNMSIIFFSLGFIINLFEEINFFKDYSVGINVPITLSILFVPSLFYKMFPFIILFSAIWFFRKLKKTEEIVPIKISGVSNISIILIPSILSIILGIFFVTVLNPISSVLVKKYEATKGGYEKDQDYLAAITINGIWIKEKTLKKNFIIRSAKLDGNYLENLTIYEFDRKNNFLRRIEAKSADISSPRWNLSQVKITDKNGNLIAENIDNLLHQSVYDLEKIKTLYSNLDTISFWNLENEIKILEERGYSTREMRTKLQQSLAFPFFLLSMILLAGVFTLGTRIKENNWTYVFVAIGASVLIFYFNDFSAALGKTDKIPVELSVWMPMTIVFIFSAVGLIHANQR